MRYRRLLNYFDTSIESVADSLTNLDRYSYIWKTFTDVSTTVNYFDKLTRTNTVTKNIEVNIYVYLFFFTEAINLIASYKYNDIYILIINTSAYQRTQENDYN